MEQRLTATTDIKPLIKKETGRGNSGPNRLWWLVEGYTNSNYHRALPPRNSVEYMSFYIREHYMVFRGERMGSNEGAFFVKSKKMNKGITALGFILLGQMMQNYSGTSTNYGKNVLFKHVIPRDEVEALLLEGAFHYRETYDHNGIFLHSLITF